MSHLTAALAGAAQGDADIARTHLRKAADMADALGLPNSTFGGGTMNFGKANVGIWQIGIGVEQGEGPGVAELARKVEWQAAPRSRQGAYWIDLGRALLQSKATSEKGLEALLHADALTPQQLRNNQFVHDAVASMWMAAVRNADGGRLHALAASIGVTSTE